MSKIDTLADALLSAPDERTLRDVRALTEHDFQQLLFALRREWAECERLVAILEGRA